MIDVKTLSNLDLLRTKELKKNFVKKCIETLGECSSIRNYDEEAYLALKGLFNRHPKSPEKIRGMVDVKIEHNPTFNQLELHIVREDGSSEDISFRKCIFRQHPLKKLYEAMRHAVHPYILDYKNTSGLGCHACGISNSEMHVDHQKPLFKELAEKFLSLKEEEGIQPPTQFVSLTGNNRAFEDIDFEFKQAWIDYHNANCKLRILCKGCNLRRPRS